MSKIITGLAFAVSISFAGAALAQSAMPERWSGPIGDAFYSDTGALTTRSEGEMKANWANLTPEQQAQAQEDCKNWEAAPKTGGDSERTGGAGMAKVCDWINGM